MGRLTICGLTANGLKPKKNFGTISKNFSQVPAIRRPDGLEAFANAASQTAGNCAGFARNVTTWPAIDGVCASSVVRAFVFRGRTSHDPTSNGSAPSRKWEVRVPQRFLANFVQVAELRQFRGAKSLKFGLTRD